MKHCCGWCNRVYQVDDKHKDVDPHKVFCSKGCLDADNIFRQLVELQHCVYIRKRIPRRLP